MPPKVATGLVVGAVVAAAVAMIARTASLRPADNGVPADGAPLPSRESRLRAARAELDAGRTWGAIAAFEALERESPGEPEVLLGIAAGRAKVRTWDSAAAALARLDDAKLTAAQRARARELSREVGAQTALSSPDAPMGARGKE